MSKFYDIIRKQHETPADNVSPVIILPGANGASYMYLKNLGEKLNWPVWYLEDGRLNPETVPPEDLSEWNKINLDYLMLYTIHAIAETLRNNGITDKPVILLGYSCAGMLLSRLMSFISKGKLASILSDNLTEEETEFQNQLAGDIQLLRDRFLLPVYIDCISPRFLNHMLSATFAKDMIHVLTQMMSQYEGFKLNGAIIWDEQKGEYKPSSGWPYDDSKVKQLRWLAENLKLRREEDEPINGVDPVGGDIAQFRRGISVMFATYAKMLADTSELHVSHGEFLKAGETIESMSSLFNEKTTLFGGNATTDDNFGYDLAKCVLTTSKTFVGFNHDSIIETEDGIVVLSNYLNNKILQSQRELEARENRYTLTKTLSQRKDSDGSEISKDDLEELQTSFELLREGKSPPVTDKSKKAPTTAMEKKL